MIALFVRKLLMCSFIRRLPPNRANGVAVFEGSPIRYNNARLHKLQYIVFFFFFFLFFFS